MESWEVLERAIPRSASGRVAQLLGIGADYVRKWRREPESEDAPTASGHRSILDRICNLLDAVFLVNPSGAGLVVNHIIEHHQDLLETHALPFTTDADKASSVSNLLTQATEAINRLNLEGCTNETLRELIELRDAAATTIIQVQKTMEEENDS
jgi:phage gp29-like protein